MEPSRTQGLDVPGSGDGATRQTAADGVEWGSSVLDAQLPQEATSPLMARSSSSSSLPRRPSSAAGARGMTSPPAVSGAAPAQMSGRSSRTPSATASRARSPPLSSSIPPDFLMDPPALTEDLSVDSFSVALNMPASPTARDRTTSSAPNIPPTLSSSDTWPTTGSPPAPPPKSPESRNKSPPNTRLASPRGSSRFLHGPVRGLVPSASRQFDGEREDLGDKGDFSFITDLCCQGEFRSMFNRVCRRCRTYLAQYQRRFSDVDEVKAARKMSPVGSPQQYRPRSVTVEDIRRQYLKNELQSTSDFDATDIIRKEDFLMKLAVALQSYGCPTPRTEYTMDLLLTTLQIRGSVNVLPALLLIELGTDVGDLGKAQTHILKAKQGLDVYKLRKVNHLATQIVNGKIPSLADAIRKLDRIIQEPPLYSWKVKLLVYVLASTALAPLFYNGSFIDGLITGMLGLIVGGLWVLSDSNYLVGKVMLVTSAFLSSFFGTVISSLYKHSCPLAIHLAPICYMLPGWSITSSVIELSTGHMISGTTRMFSALMNALLLAFGTDLGHRAAFWHDESWASTTTCQPVNRWFKIPLFLFTTTSFHILMKAAPAQYLGMTVVSSLSYTMINFTGSRMTPSTSSMLTAFVVGIAGNIYGLITNSPALIPILSGIFLIVPGSMSVKGIHAMLTNDMSIGLNFGWTMMLVAISIAVGLFASTVLMYRTNVKVSNAVFF